MATRIDLDDLPPKIAAALAAADEIELVRDGVVVARLTVETAKPPSPQPPPPVEDLRQVFDDFRSAVEDEF